MNQQLDALAIPCWQWQTADDDLRPCAAPKWLLPSGMSAVRRFLSSPRPLMVCVLVDLGTIVFADAPSAMVQSGQELAFCCLRHIQNQQQPTEG